jgi:hypothetical protein
MEKKLEWHTALEKGLLGRRCPRKDGKMEIQSVFGLANGTEATRHRRNNGVRRRWSPQALYLTLKRRGVLEAGTNYIVVAWLIAQVAEMIGEIFEAPYWILQALLIALATGLPVALLLSWVFELTPDGLKREDELDSAAPLTRPKGRGLVCALIAILVLTIGALAVNRQASVCAIPPQATMQQADMPKNI